MTLKHPFAAQASGGRRGRSSSNEDVGSLTPRRVYFPLLAVLLRAWLATCGERAEDEDAPERVQLRVDALGASPRSFRAGLRASRDLSS